MRLPPALGGRERVTVVTGVISLLRRCQVRFGNHKSIKTHQFAHGLLVHSEDMHMYIDLLTPRENETWRLAV